MAVFTELFPELYTELFSELCTELFRAGDRTKRTRPRARLWRAGVSDESRGGGVG